MHDNGRTLRITENEDRDVTPGVTERGTVYWRRGIGDAGITKFMIFTRGEEIQLVDQPMGIVGGELNDQGQYVWAERLNQGCGDADLALFFFDGERTRLLRNGAGSYQRTSLNEFGEIAWTEIDFCQNPHAYSVVLYIDGSFLTLEQDYQFASVPSLNERSQIAYTAWNAGGESVTRLWENGTSRTIIEDQNSTSRMNNRGDVTFQRMHPPESGYQQVWLYDAETEEQTPLTEDPFHQAAWAINDYREVLISSGEFSPNSQVRFLRRIRTGDSEFDGDIDHDDLAKLVDCMTGPMWVERTDPGPEDSLCECRFLDINHDGSVDLRDYAIFQQNFGG